MQSIFRRGKTDPFRGPSKHRARKTHWILHSEAVRRILPVGPEADKWIVEIPGQLGTTRTSRKAV